MDNAGHMYVYHIEKMGIFCTSYSHLQYENCDIYILNLLLWAGLWVHPACYPVGTAG